MALSMIFNFRGVRFLMDIRSAHRLDLALGVVVDVLASLILLLNLVALGVEDLIVAAAQELLPVAHPIAVMFNLGLMGLAVGRGLLPYAF